VCVCIYIAYIHTYSFIYIYIYISLYPYVKLQLYPHAVLTRLLFIKKESNSQWGIKGVFVQNVAKYSLPHNSTLHFPSPYLPHSPKLYCISSLPLLYVFGSLRGVHFLLVPSTLTNVEPLTVSPFLVSSSSSSSSS
jgi:hypothetical protein